ncbi:MAG TPA: hypothetical protein VFT32_01090 [Candidatus Eisenbacteria bacterium]|nr:hypothetical protein [Candidatus Eisenbacteria bacterium]
MATFVQRMIGAAKLDVPVIEEIEADKDATMPALGVVILSSIAAGIGGVAGGATGFGVLLVSALFGWVFWAFMTWVIGTKFLAGPDTKSDIGELMRTMGFAQSPGLLRVFAAIPLVGWVIEFAIWIWLLVAMVVAVRQSLDYKSTGRALVVCAIGWAINAAMTIFALSLVGLGGMAAGTWGG